MDNNIHILKVKLSDGNIKELVLPAPSPTDPQSLVLWQSGNLSLVLTYMEPENLSVKLAKVHLFRDFARICTEQLLVSQLPPQALADVTVQKGLALHGISSIGCTRLMGHALAHGLTEEMSLQLEETAHLLKDGLAEMGLTF